ncbi:hypothetical protein QOZ80_6BG0501640 [Eleusine coracana subsp. coracana]|nr:hypothetical protein QOZ80_6BG0501640 [Eleusine coracana subsp. coracana]
MAHRGDGAAAPGNRERLQNLFLDAAQLLMLCGAVGVVSVAVSPNGGNATQAFICLLLWLLGVCFLPVAVQFPRAALAAAAMAQIVLKHFFTLWN